MKKIVVLLLIIATVLNIGAGAFIFLDIQAMNVPETLLTMELVDLTADEAVLQITLFINNPNSFSISLQDLTVTITTDTGDDISTLFIEGGEVPAQKNRTFIETEPLRFNKTVPNQLTSTMTGTIGVMFLGIVKKTLPLKFSMITPLGTIVDQMTLPSIHLTGNFSELTQQGINFTAAVELTNPYSFTITVDNLLVTMKTDTGIQVGTLTLQGETIPAKTTRQLTGKGTISLKALDAKTIQMSLNGGIVVHIAGIEKTLNLSFDSDIIVPRLEELLTGLPTDSTLRTNYKFTFKGFLETITFEIINPNKITLLATDTTIHLYRIDKNHTRLIANGTLENGIIAPQATTALHGTLLIPYSQMFIPFKERILPDRLQVIMRANITIPGLNQTLWVGMIGYQDFRQVR